MGHGASELTEFWGKTCPAEQAHSSFPFKPVVHHLLDVAAVALRLQELSLSRLARESAVMGIPLERVANVSAWLAGLHDLGKFSLSFQAKRPDLFPKHLPPIRESPSDRGHWRNTAIMLRSPELQRELHSIFPAVGDGLALIAASIAGHHGRPPTAQEYRFNIHGFRWEKEVTPPSLAAGLRDASPAGSPRPAPASRNRHDAQGAGLVLATGELTTLADWIGSDNAFSASKILRCQLMHTGGWPFEERTTRSTRRASCRRGYATRSASQRWCPASTAADAGRGRFRRAP